MDDEQVVNKCYTTTYALINKIAGDINSFTPTVEYDWRQSWLLIVKTALKSPSNTNQYKKIDR